MGKTSIALAILLLSQWVGALEEPTSLLIEPGCVSGVLNSAAMDCKPSVKTNEVFLKKYLEDPKKAKLELAFGLKKIKAMSSYSYAPIFLSSFLNIKESLGELKRIAKIENGLVNRFAQMASAKMESGTCPRYSDPIFHEICHYQDPIFEKLKKLKGIQ